MRKSWELAVAKSNSNLNPVSKAKLDIIHETYKIFSPKHN